MSLIDDETVSQNSSISDIRWLEMKMARPSFFTFSRRKESISWVPSGSIPFVGSSRIRSRGPPQHGPPNAEALLHSRGINPHPVMLPSSQSNAFEYFVNFMR